MNIYHHLIFLVVGFLVIPAGLFIFNIPFPSVKGDPVEGTLVAIPVYATLLYMFFVIFSSFRTLARDLVSGGLINVTTAICFVIVSWILVNAIAVWVFATMPTRISWFPQVNYWQSALIVSFHLWLSMFGTWAQNRSES